MRMAIMDWQTGIEDGRLQIVVLSRRRGWRMHGRAWLSALALFLFLAAPDGRAWLVRSPQALPQAAAPSGNRLGSSPVSTSVLVRVQHQVIRLEQARRMSIMTAEESGTVVGPHTILTHGHYCPCRDPSYILEAMVLTLQGSPASTFVDMSWIATPYLDAGTTLLVLPDWMRLPQAATLGDPAQLRAGDAVTVAYWDEANRRMALLESTITRTDGRTARVRDLGRVVKPGDSGGAVYNARGELVGNVWSIGMSGRGQRLPWLEVALLPAGIGEDIR
jgi:hypothetical protein